jgi:pimeloyl-ACP methyl ester carboxylesterase
MDRAELALLESGIELPIGYRTAASAFRMLSPATLNNDAAASLWLETFQLSGKETARGQAWVDTGRDRREALRAVTVPCRVIAFADDCITPPHLAAEVAEAIPDCDFVEIPACGHFGYLERPDEVNSAIIEFLDKN